LIERTNPGEVLLAGGETTVKVGGNGVGGRNQETVLATIPDLDDKTVIASIDSDGWDNTDHAGALGDSESVNKEARLGIDSLSFLSTNESYAYFEKTGDGILTGRLPSNVADLFVVLKTKS
jgi:glycerate-2-kinase